MRDNNYDYVVIGGGASGCAVAGRLSEDSSKRVILVEAGGVDRNPLFRIPGLGFLVSRDKKYNWWFETEPVQDLNNRKLRWLQGKILGGSSAINGMIYTRGHSKEYDSWRDMGCDGWSFDDVLPYFKKAESNFRGDNHWHSGSGAMSVRRANPNLPICDAFLRAFGESGFPILDDFNQDTVEGFGYYDVNIGRGKRISSAAAYLHSARHRPNLTIMTNAHALRVIIENGRAKGVEIRHQGQTQTLWAEREVIVSCGGVQSPQLLMLSGIGPADHLKTHGIPVVVDSPNVGQNLQNHPSYALQFACSQPVTAYKYLNPFVGAKSVLEYLFLKQGGLGEGFVSVGGFLRTDPSLERPDAQVVMSSALMAKPGTTTFRLRDTLPKQHGFSVTVYQGTPFSRGEIRLASADPMKQAKIFPNYFRDPRDMGVACKAIGRVREVLRNKAISRYISQEIQPGDAVRTEADLEASIRQNISTSYHQSGTCVMGSDPASVVDPELRVRGVEGLRVADVSILPFLLSCALHAPALMIGEKAAAMIAH